MMLKWAKSEKGISLTEFLVTAAILWIVIGAVYTLLIGGQDIFNIGDKQVAAQQSARIALLRMTKEIRQSYRLENTATYPSPPTSSTTLSLKGIQVVEENLTEDVTNNRATSQYNPWLQGASPIVYKKPSGSPNWSILSSGYQIDYAGGYLFNFVPVLAAGDEIKASYTRDVYLQYYVSDSTLKRKAVYDDGVNPPTTLSDEVVANYLASSNIFSRDDATSNLIKVTLLIDEDPSKPPAAFRLETEIRLRK